MWSIKLGKQAETDLAWLRKHDKRAYIKCFDLLRDMFQNPYDGLGKPERLRHVDGEVWSRRISPQHRLVYTIEEEHISVTSCRTHYGDR